MCRSACVVSGVDPHDPSVTEGAQQDSRPRPARMQLSQSDPARSKRVHHVTRDVASLTVEGVGPSSLQTRTRRSWPTGPSKRFSANACGTRQPQASQRTTEKEWQRTATRGSPTSSLLQMVSCIGAQHQKFLEFASCSATPRKSSLASWPLRCV